MEQEIEVILALSNEIQTELRARRDAEHLYTAAFVGASGAVAWGVATIAAITNPTFDWIHPAIAGLSMIWLIAIAIAVKTLREHLVHRDLRKQADTLGAALLEKNTGLADIWPNHMKATKDKRASSRLIRITGATYSLVVIALTAVGATVFCLSVYWA